VCEGGDILGGTETMLSREAIEDSELEDASDTEKDRFYRSC